MTAQDAMLKLALNFHPDAYVDANGTVWTGPRGPANDIFDPANNDSQAVSVLLWLLAQHPPHHYEDEEHTTMFEVIGRYIHQTILIGGYESVAVWSIDHDRTPASFRAAVTKAALRVVG